MVVAVQSVKSSGGTQCRVFVVISRRSVCVDDGRRLGAFRTVNGA